MGIKCASSRVTFIASSFDNGASTNPTSAPDALAILMRSMASSKPCVWSESVRAMISGAEGLLDLAATHALILCAHSSLETTSLPPRCPHRFGLVEILETLIRHRHDWVDQVLGAATYITWSSICNAAAPALSYIWTVRAMLSTEPNPVSASAIMGVSPAIDVNVNKLEMNMSWVAMPRSASGFTLACLHVWGFGLNTNVDPVGSQP